MTREYDSFIRIALHSVQAGILCIPDNAHITDGKSLWEQMSEDTP
jgi:hypothetical protein